MNDIPRLKNKMNELKQLLSALSEKNTYSEKLTVLNQLPIVKTYLSTPGPIQEFLQALTAESEFAMKAIIAIGQAPVIFNIKNLDAQHFNKLLALLEQLLEIEFFYDFLGGIIGYHYTTLTLIYDHLKSNSPAFDHMHYIQPEGMNLTKDTPEVRQAVRWGIENIQHIAAIYPVGGSGDRLNLKDEKTGESLPTAVLPFLGLTLLDGIIRDLQAQEYLAFKLLGQQYKTPIAIMTSVEKNNHIHILNICKKANWFGRGSKNFYFFIQPLAPVITLEGNWSLSTPLTLNLKPSGHGVLWKLAKEAGVFQWLESQERYQCVVRQINNPLGATDQGLFALIGIGCAQNKTFGFLSCERLLHSEEGTNVLIEKQVKQDQAQQGQPQQGYQYCLTNIEYTEFAQRGIGEIPRSPESHYSVYPTNTNIFFSNISSIQKILPICPIPGQLINMKSEVPYLDPEGNLSHVPGGRLESTMQNIADYIIDHFPCRLNTNEYQTALQSFILYNCRSKTISPTKKLYQPGGSLNSTPEQAFYDLLLNNHHLLKQCQFELPPWQKIEEYLMDGPSFIFLFHPGLGPLYSVIAQKIRRGRLSPQAELQLEIAEVDIEDLFLEGSLLIQATSPLGTHNDSGILEYGHESRCTLKNVKIKNQGIDHSVKQHYWKNTFSRKEVIKIILHEGAEFHAESLSLEGSHHFEVPARHRLILRQNLKGKLILELSAIEKPTWNWHYCFDSDNVIQLKRTD